MYVDKAAYKTEIVHIEEKENNNPQIHSIVTKVN
jgi:hypothetical protein